MNKTRFKYVTERVDAAKVHVALPSLMNDSDSTSNKTQENIVQRSRIMIINVSEQLNTFRKLFVRKVLKE